MLLASSARLNPQPGPCQEWAAVIQDVSLQVHGPHTHRTQEITASPGPGITCVPSWPPRCPVGVDATVITLLTQTSVLRLTVQLFFFLTSCFIFCLLFWTPCSLIIVPTPPPPPGLSTYRILLVQTQCWRALQTQHRGISGHDLRCVPVKAGVKAVYGPVRRSTSTFTAFSIWPLTLGLEPVCGVLNLPMYSKPNTTRPHFELLLVYIFLDIFTYWSFGLITV